MSTYGFFQPAVMGMNGQSYSLAVTAGNIANVRTGGFKRTDTHFETVLSSTFSSQPGSGENPAPSGTSHSDFGGVLPIAHNRVSLQGPIESTDRQLDAAIDGSGFFILDTRLDGSGGRLYGRDGRFSMRSDASQGEGAYLSDKNGYFVMGWEIGADGTTPTDANSLTSLRIDPEAFAAVGAPTTHAALGLNLPAEDAVGSARAYTIDAYDSGGVRRDLRLSFTKQAARNTWAFDVSAAAGDAITISPPGDFRFTAAANQEVAFDPLTGTMAVRAAGGGAPAVGTFAALSAGDPFTLSGSTFNDGTFTVASVSADGSTITFDPATPVAASEISAGPIDVSAATAFWHALAFGADGYLVTPKSVQIAVAHAGGGNTAFDLDLATMTQFGGPFTATAYDHDGFAASPLRTVEFDVKGRVIGVFESGMTKPLYKLALADFRNPDGLDPRNGNVYAQSAEAGDIAIAGAREGGMGALVPTARELSNVELAKEFSDMIVAQNAYNASATSFRTMNEMTETARDLKT